MYRHKKWKLVLLAVVALLCIAMVCGTIAVQQSLQAATQALVQSTISNLLQQAAFTHLTPTTVQTITDTLLDVEGHMSVLTVNSVLLSQTAWNICDTAQTNLIATTPLTLILPLGTALKMPWLDFLHISLQRKVDVTAAFAYNFESYTQESGIVVHKIDLQINCATVANIRGKQYENAFSVVLPIAEAIVMGGK